MKAIDTWGSPLRDGDRGGEGPKLFQVEMN